MLVEFLRRSHSGTVAGAVQGTADRKLPCDRHGPAAQSFLRRGISGPPRDSAPLLSVGCSVLDMSSQGCRGSGSDVGASAHSPSQSLGLAALVKKRRGLDSSCWQLAGSTLGLRFSYRWGAELSSQDPCILCGTYALKPPKKLQRLTGLPRS